jgi:hypothetical protein
LVYALTRPAAEATDTALYVCHRAIDMRAGARSMGPGWPGCWQADKPTNAKTSASDALPRVLMRKSSQPRSVMSTDL